MIYTPLTNKALTIAFETHKEQKDKSGMPYVFHPFHLAEQMDDEYSVCVALLHDTVEDGNITIEMLEKEGFPKAVTDAVALLTHDPEVPYFDYIDKIRQNPLAVKVKLADLRHNSDDTRLDELDGHAKQRSQKYKEAIKILKTPVKGKRRIKLSDRILPKYTKGEEIFNMVTHIVGGGVGIATLALCIIISSLKGSLVSILTSIVFGASMIMLYAMSSIYHGLTTDISKKVFQVLDHCTIYFLIAGTYTPILLCAVINVNFWAAIITFAAVWGCAAIAIVLTSIDLKKYKIFSMICYIGMGWCIIFSAKDVITAIGQMGFGLLLGGGILYTIGAILYGVGKKIKYFHSIFHIFIVLASICHSLCIMLTVI